MAFKGFDDLEVEEEKKLVSKNKGGRPKKNDSDKATKKITINVTEQQYEDISKKATMKGQNIASFIKMQLMG